jgi:hypothetical protein
MVWLGYRHDAWFGSGHCQRSSGAGERSSSSNPRFGDQSFVHLRRNGSVGLRVAEVVFSSNVTLFENAAVLDNGAELC